MAGQGNIRRRGPGKWQISFEQDRNPDGFRSRFTLTILGTRADAARELTRRLAEYQAGKRDPTPCTLTLAEFLERWLRDYVELETEPTTARHWRSLVANHIGPALGHLPLARLSGMDLQSHYAEQRRTGQLDGRGGLSPGAVHNQHTLLTRALRQAVRWKLIPRSPLEDVDPPGRVSKPPTALPLPDVARLLAQVAGTEFELPVLLAVATGCRAGELAGLRWSDIEWESRLLTVSRQLRRVQRADGWHLEEAPPKTKQTKRLTLPEVVAERLWTEREAQAGRAVELGEYWIGGGWICARVDGRCWDPTLLSTLWGRRREAWGFPRLRLHDLRHTNISLALSLGVPVSVVSQRAGHSNQNTTLARYSHALPGGDEAAAGVMDGALRGVLKASDVGRMSAEGEIQG